jgi:hypothetical protein
MIDEGNNTSHIFFENFKTTMNETKLIKGQAWISGNSLVQDQIMVVPGVDSFSNTICLIQDIWADLTSSSGQYKTNSKGDYFYWEVKQTTVDNPDVEITVNFECPRPKEGLFEPPYDPDSVQGDYAKYWVSKFKATEENFNDKATIQKKEVIFPETEYMSFTDGEFKHVEEKEVKNNDLGPIDNLLNMY